MCQGFQGRGQKVFTLPQEGNSKVSQLLIQYGQTIFMWFGPGSDDCEEVCWDLRVTGSAQTPSWLCIVTSQLSDGQSASKISILAFTDWYSRFRDHHKKSTARSPRARVRWLICSDRRRHISTESCQPQSRVGGIEIKKLTYAKGYRT